MSSNAAGQGLGHESFSTEKVLNPASHRRAPAFESIPASADASLRVLTSTLCESLLAGTVRCVNMFAV